MQLHKLGGKVIDNFECYLASVLESDAAKQSEIGDNVTLTLASGTKFNAEITYISKEETGKTLLVFKLKQLTNELIEYRKISFNITWWSDSGLKVPNTSIVEGENELKYVIRSMSDGNKKVLVKVLKRNEKYSLIGTYTPEELVSLGIDAETSSKISEHDAILLYANEN